MSSGGAGVADMTDFDTDDFSFSDLTNRLQKLGDPERQRAVRRLTQIYCPGDLEEPGKSPIRPPRSTSRVSHSPGSLSNITVENPSDKKLPRFSGRDTPGHGEVDFRKWDRCAQRLFDENISEEQKKRILLKSLCGEADDIAELNKTKSVSEILAVLQNTYGCMIDGEELLIKFYQMQQKKPNASEFLNELYIELGDVVKYKGLSQSKFDSTLLKQFIRGSTDQMLLLKLRLEEQVDNPPAYPDLIKSIRREEAVRTGRKVQQKLQAKSQVTHAVSSDEADSPPVRKSGDSGSTIPATISTPTMATNVQVASLNQEVAYLQQRLASCEQRLANKKASKIFCYRCGLDDGHMATDCVNPPNKYLVQQKQEERKKNFKRSQ